MKNPGRAVFVLACLAGASSLAHAGNVVTDDLSLDEGNVTALLEATSQRYVDAMHRLIEARYRDDYRAIRWEDLEISITRARVARFEYHYTANGADRTRVYHAMGGEPLSSLGGQIFEGPTRAGTPVSPDSPASMDEAEVFREPPAPTIDRVAADAADDALFSGFDDVDIRARILPTGNSVLQPFPIDGEDKALDPEFKLLRHIEHDIQNGIVPSGGRIQGAIGGNLCSSCRYAMKSLSNEYGIEVRVTQMFASLPRREQDALVQSGRAVLKGRLLVDARSERPLLAYDALNRARTAQVQQKLGPRAMGRTFKGMLWRNRSFRFKLDPPRLRRVSESPPDSSPLTANRDVEEPTPRCD
ncbi:hypothetical protein [Luteibacter yeojuensis]|uniref:Uncharacterized protein n=1 Tax=Luteibacter yeojuensis TaxID=345309 RepID=A0A7X5QVF2_9GAMM|nr:hypothetical protein [Luteibacter yeojuensis]NID16153.1 hypothetical protein [Luteibacter yeojuensis]